MRIRTLALLIVATGVSLGYVTMAGAGDSKAEKAKTKKAKAAACKEKTKEEKEAKNEACAEKAVAKREENQARRIRNGIKNGSLTQNEINTLLAQQKSIAALAGTLKADGVLSKDDRKQLQTALDDASHCIWAEKHDTDGNQMPVCRLGKDVFAKGCLTSQLADENLSAANAKALMHDFHRTVELKRRLATEDLTDGERTAMQTEYDSLLNTYFELR